MLHFQLNNLCEFCRLALKESEEIRDKVAHAQTTEQFRLCVNRLKAKFEPYHTGQAIWVNEEEQRTDYNLSLPPWICQPYIRMEPEKHIEYIADKQRQAAEREKMQYFDDDGQKISKKTLKRLRRASRKPNSNGLRQKQTRSFELCCALKCANPTVRHYPSFGIVILIKSQPSVLIILSLYCLGSEM